jgi:YegS/Rv2252/BmrU family lipid kinase
MMRKILIVANPTSGGGRAENAIPQFLGILEKFQIHNENLKVDLVRTEFTGHGIELAKEGAEQGYDVVAAAGGDGTVNEVINGLARKKLNGGVKPALGVLPVGRGNDFAFGIGLGTDLENACHILAEGNPKAIDIGFVRGGDYPEGRYFGNGVGIGFDTIVGLEAQKYKQYGGFPSYIIGALKTVFLYNKAPVVQVEYGNPGKNKIIEQPSMMVSIMNGRRMGGGFLMAPNGQVSDGLLDLCIAGEVSRMKILALIPKFMKGTQVGHPAIKMTHAGHVTVIARTGSLPAHADGETLCVDGSRLDIQLLPGFLNVLTI